jgi:hypothetical protein
MVGMSTGRAVRAIGLAGLLAGTLDILAAFVVYGLRGAKPLGILQSVASGLVGRTAAYGGGGKTAALGLALHFFIATSAAAVYYAASRRLDVLVKHAVFSGIAYGVAVWLFMNFVVIPLSAIGRWPTINGLAAVIVVVHMVCVGLPIALVVRHYSVRS